MKIKYRLFENLLKRNAMNLVDSLHNIQSSIYLSKNEDRKINAKSQIGVLSGYFLSGDLISVEIESIDDIGNVKKVLNKYGKEVQEEI